MASIEQVSMSQKTTGIQLFSLCFHLCIYIYISYTNEYIYIYICACTKCLLIVTSTQGYNPHVWGHGTLASYWLLWEISARGYILMYGGMTYGPRVYVCHVTILARKRYAARTKPKLSFIFHCLGSSTMSRVRFMDAVTGEELHLPPRISTSIRARRVRTVIY